LSKIENLLSTRLISTLCIIAFSIFYILLHIFSFINNNKGMNEWTASVDMMMIISYILFSFSFSFWYYSIHKILKYIGVKGLKHSTWKILISMFVPILNLVKSYKGIKELWRATDPNDMSFDGFSWKKIKVPPGYAMLFVFAVIIISINAISKGFVCTNMAEGQCFSFYQILNIPFLGIILSSISCLMYNIMVRQINTRLDKKVKNIRYNQYKDS
jgi:hypothetical protein